MRLYGAIKDDKDILLSTVRFSRAEAFKALISKLTWTNCFDQEFKPSKKDLTGYKIIELELKAK